MKRKSFLRYTFLLTGLSFIKTTPLSAFYTRTRRFFVNKVKFIWSGAVTANSIRVHAKLTSPSTTVRLVVGTDPGLANPTYGSSSTADANNNYVARLSVSGLQPATTYYYGIEADGLLDTATDAIGTFKTVGNAAHSFKFSIASCNRDGNHPVFYRIKEKNPAFHITHGDFHYGDPNSATDINVHRAPFENTLAQPAIRELLQHHPVAYMWDDHDYCGDNTNAFAVGRTNARTVYQEYVPHYPLAAGTGNVPIYQSFVIGRMRFILTDLRSERDVPGTSMMGAAQKAWFKTECLAAKNSGQGIIWISTVPWGNTPDTDIWYGFSQERTELSDFFKANAITNLFIICGDAHMIAIDNGTNHDFSTGGANPYKYHVLQAAAVNQVGSFRGGPFSEGSFLNPSFEYGQYVLVEVTDTGGSNMTISLTGYRVNNAGVESTLINYSFSFTLLSVLPIKIGAFSVTKSGDSSKALLSFQIESTAGSVCKELVIERSRDARNYEAIERIPCSSTLNRTNHFVTDHSPLDGLNHYRLKVIGQDTSPTYSDIKSIEFDTKSSITLLNNPVRQQLKLAIDVKRTTTSTYFVQDSAGRTILKGNMHLGRGRTTHTIKTSSLAKGVYFFVTTIERLHLEKKFVIE